MENGTHSMVRWTIGSALGLALLFMGVGLVRAIGADADLAAVAAPLAAFGIVGFTVGGLVGPLLRGLWKHWS